VADNTTPYTAHHYESEVLRTIPLYAELCATVIDVALAAVPSPATWLDTGAGTGQLVAAARERAPQTRFFVADPSAAMLEHARARLADLGPERFLSVTTQELPGGPPLDVITAVQCHHYGDMDARERALTRCRARLAPGGALVVFENVRAESERGDALQRARWRAWLRAQGRDDRTIEAYFAREGRVIFPVRVTEHLDLLRRVGFPTVEIVWRAYGQAGFLALPS
jgi:tRNA (cmo5U34)-methyltransferase